ncbi:MAG: bifunctional DNA-formamidopyrimidine glycosylase/DNA-(apurinic or apyrimidinic site) lyase [Proteobacteria bacterium]|jgi:formamidopyrimidine-DNA glycosylase|nr:bifunctional DNA-formamidopyrimidine glycosylase/DNA-(apurinic or apyrimidinic site) lyase [Pseudomonadota bacterium]
MPELPEVEVTRRTFAERIRGARVQAVRLGQPLRWQLGVAPEQLLGRTVRTVGRRGKYLVMELDEGILLLHLGMSGSLRFETALPAPGRHDHFDLTTDRGVLRLHDPRRFGAVVWAEDLDADVALRLLGSLGVEPLSDDFHPQAFHDGLKTRRAPIKQVLLEGRLVVGVGNIYASEALFLAGIRPTTRADRLSRPRSDRLHAAIRQVLGRAVERGGSTLRNYYNASGEAGRFQSEAAVYGRAGQPCLTCGAPVRQIRQGQRSTFYCPVCQRG